MIDTSLIPTKKILIVDDEKPIAMAMALKLQKAGLQTKVIFNGADAIQLLQNEQFDIVILDLIMPVMDGWDVLQKIRELQIKTKVIITSNLTQEEDQQKAKKLGAISYLVKSDTSLATVVDEILNNL